MKKLLFALIALCALSSVMAQTDSTAVEETETESSANYESIDPRKVAQRKGYESEKLDQKNFDQKKWRQVVGSEDFIEGASARKKEQPADEAKRKDSDVSLPINSPLLKVIVYAIAIGIMGYILYLIINGTSFRAKHKISKPTTADASAHITDIKTLEIDDLLRNALAAGNYRLAIRIYFLGLLKKLDEEGFIKWKKDKTNNDYLSELFATAYYFEEIRRLTLVYEQVWYGEHPLSPAVFEQITASFQSIDQRLNATKDL
jgi:hypothetical protein